jgi:hypothetical protein
MITGGKVEMIQTRMPLEFLLSLSDIVSTACPQVIFDTRERASGRFQDRARGLESHFRGSEGPTCPSD